MMCCSRLETQVVRARADMNGAARIAARREHPRYIELANQRKADYIRCREAQAAHLAEHERSDA